MPAATPVAATAEPVHGFGYWWAALFGSLLVLIGLVLAGGGAWLAVLGGSWYYLVAGLGLVLAGGLTATQHRSGPLVYALIWLGTLAWAFWEVGLDGWALVPRIVAPSVLLVLALLTIPAIRRPLLPVTTTLLALLLVAPHPAPAQAVRAREVLTPATAAPEAQAAPEAAPPPLQAGADWPAYGGTNAALRFSPLAEITPENVARLQPAWTFHTGDLPDAAAKDKYSPENTPLKVGDSLYVCTA